MQAALKDCSVETFRLLKELFLYLVRKLSQNYRSKRQIIMLTTVVRALQYTMDVAVDSKKLRLPDQEAVILFLHFYKLIFLGTKFAEKVLQIKWQNQPGQEGQEKQLLIEEETKESKVEPMVIDTSEISEPDHNAQNSSGSSQKAESIPDKEDNYIKIKMHAIHCLQTLFKCNNTAFSLKSLYHPIFPSCLTNPRPEFISSLFDFTSPQAKLEFTAKSLDELKREPTFFYLIRGLENGSKFRIAVCSAVSTLIENSEIIQKWQGQLEYIKESKENAGSKVCEPLGMFLRLLHYTVVTMIETENDPQMLLAQIKIANTILHQTPYSKMLPGLASILMQNITDQIKQPSSLANKCKLKFPAILQ